MFCKYIAVRLQRTTAGDSARAGVEMGQTGLETSGATAVASRRGVYIYRWSIFFINCCVVLVGYASVCVGGGGERGSSNCFLLLLSSLLPCAFSLSRFIYCYVNYPLVSATVAETTPPSGGFYFINIENAATTRFAFVLVY